MEIITKKLAELHPAEYNPRRELQPGEPEFEKLRNSIAAFGDVEPIIWNRRTNTVVGGHQRLNVMLALGYEEAQVSVVDISLTEEKQLNIALNRIQGTWDEEKLRIVLSSIAEAGGDATLTGFDNDELSAMFADLAPEAMEEDFDVDGELAKPEITRAGDVWTLGRHRLICGDSTAPETLTALMAGAKARLLITDPPYNVDYGDKADALSRRDKSHRQNDRIANDNLPETAFTAFLTDALTAASEQLTDGAAFYIFYAHASARQFLDAMFAAGLAPHQTLIWEKNSFVLSRQDYHWRHEPVFYGWTAGAAHYFIDDRTQDTILGGDDIDFGKMKKAELVAWIEGFIRDSFGSTSILKVDKPQRSELHPTMKPVELIGRLVHNSSQIGWNVLDPFGGSGSTLVACEKTHRNCFTAELLPKYCDVIVARYLALGHAPEEVTVTRAGKQLRFEEAAR